jgi:hypothetical protein
MRYLVNPLPCPTLKTLPKRTSTGAELDLVLEKGRKRIAVECKLSAAPEVGQGFWSAVADLEINETWIIAPVKQSYPIKKGVTVAPLMEFIESHRNS